MKISFIVPVYKVEKFLDECVQSIISQTYENIEILLVDDGSPDNCPQMCDDWALKDLRVKALHKPNGGLSDARNFGLQNATGDYVIFVDSDDFWRQSDDLEKLVNRIECFPNLDFIGFNCSYLYQNSGKFAQWVQYDKDLSKPVCGDYAIKKLVGSGTVPMGAWMKVIKRDFLIYNNIHFIKGQIHEDIPWFINLLEKTKKCIFINEYIYAYRQNVAGSITNSINEKGFYCLLDIVKSELDKLGNRDFSRDSKDSIKSFLAYELSILMMEVHLLPKEKRESARDEIKALSWIFSYNQNPKTRLVNKVYSLFGFAITERILRAYNWYRCHKG